MIWSTATPTYVHRDGLSTFLLEAAVHYQSLPTGPVSSEDIHTALASDATTHCHVQPEPSLMARSIVR